MNEQLLSEKELLTELSTRPTFVLVVDDSAISRRKIALAIEALGHRTETVDSGEAALGRLGEGSFDLVILDIVMPVMDGFAVLQTMKSDPALRDIPVIVVSGLNDESDRVARAIELGAEDFLPKDFQKAILKARVGASLERKQHRDRELAYKHNIDILIGAARVIEAGDFRPKELNVGQVAARQDSLGSLAQVFEGLASEVYERERRSDTEQAVSLMSHAKELAGEHWSFDSEETL